MRKNNAVFWHFQKGNSIPLMAFETELRYQLFIFSEKAAR